MSLNALLQRRSLRLFFQRPTRAKPLQEFLDGSNQLLVLGIRQIHLARIHLEHASVIRTVHILGRQVEMKVRQLVAVGSIVDFLRLEGLLHGTGHTGHIGHKGIAVFVA